MLGTFVKSSSLISLNLHIHSVSNHFPHDYPQGAQLVYHVTDLDGRHLRLGYFSDPNNFSDNFIFLGLRNLKIVFPLLYLILKLVRNIFIFANFLIKKDLLDSLFCKKILQVLNLYLKLRFIHSSGKH